ncbi:MAG: hypothetical protein KC431_20295, partial [Myxococcales bacterium]|nr:hypothetical protein [Myxococcales bacterium]
LLWLDPGEGRLHELTLGGVEDVRSFDVGPDRLFAADGQGVIWERQLSQAEPGQVPRLGGWKRLFRNKSRSLLPDGFQVGFPYGYDEVGLAEVVDLRWVEHYRGLLVADRFPLGVDDPRLERELSERIHLRFFDLDEARVLPWIKPMVHGDVYQLWNEQAQIIAGYHHEGSLALVQHDASLFWLERGRSRLLRIGDGMLGTAKTGNHHARNTTVPLFQTIWKVSGRVERQLRPDRHLDARHEYLPRRGPFVAVMFNSSLSSMSDRFSNYSFGRRLELELGRELGYRDGVRLDLFQVSSGAASFLTNVQKLENWMSDSVPPDLVFIEIHDFGGALLSKGKDKGRLDDRELSGLFAKIEALAARYGTMVIFYDHAWMEANGREAMRNSSPGVRKILEQAKQLGFVVLEPGDALLAKLLTDSPWGNQAFGPNQHHGAVWSVNLSAAAMTALAYPQVSAFLREREPA